MNNMVLFNAEPVGVFTDQVNAIELFNAEPFWGVVEPQVLTSLSVSPVRVRVKIESQRQFSAIAYDQTGTAMDTHPEFSWSTDSEYGSINAQGLFTAGSTPEECTVTATVGLITKDAVVRVLEKIPSTLYRARVAAKVGF